MNGLMMNNVYKLTAPCIFIDGLMVCPTDELIIQSDDELMAENTWIIYIHR
jgi:hypothetical protein